jgi:hypothetical protein
MKRIIRLTESDLTRIVRNVISEATVDERYFHRRGIDIEKVLEETLLKINVCKYAKLRTYFNHVMDELLVKLYLSNETIRKELVSDQNNLERDIKKYFIDHRLDFLIYYYKLKCRKDVKY